MDAKETGNRIILIGIVLDTTLSFSAVYPQIYYMLERLLISMEGTDVKNDLIIKYGLTLIHNDAENLVFDNNEKYTEDYIDVLHRLSEIDFYGGQPDGTENIGSAVMIQLSAMCEYEADNEEDLYKILFVFTDSIPLDNEMFPDFTEPFMFDNSNIVNKGINSAYIYSYSGEYMPQLRIVNDNGSVAENARGTCIYESLRKVIEWNEAETINNMEELAVSIRKQLGE